MKNFFKMIYNFQSQTLNVNPVELAQKRLKFHQEKGLNSPLSIFEVANLMDTIIFKGSHSNSEKQNLIQVCFN
jgi:hypothetical protein